MGRGGEYWMEKTKEGNENENEMSDVVEKKKDEMQNKMTKKKMKRNSKEKGKDEMPNMKTKKKSSKPT
jgi:hypothetical protein